MFGVEDLEHIEAYLASGMAVEAMPCAEAAVAEMETYIDENCAVSDEVQYFSFSSQFEKLTYARVEGDPRKLVAAPAPFDRAYADYAYCLIAQHDMEAGREALKQAVRWNPMDCAHRLDLAAVMANQGDIDEYLALSYSVFARASRASSLVRAYLNFAGYFEEQDLCDAAAACVYAALRLSPLDARAAAFADRLAKERGRDPRAMDAAAAAHLLDEQGIPEGANVEVVISALLLAQIAEERGDADTRDEMVRVAAELVGRETAASLMRAIREQD